MIHDLEIVDVMTWEGDSTPPYDFAWRLNICP